MPAAALLLALTVCGPVAAAVRVCQSPQSSGLVSGATEVEARRKAIEAWTLKARVIGERYAGWPVAAQKLLRCAPAKDGHFDCVAIGQPCTVQQAPPKPRRRFGPPGKPLDV